MKILLSWLKEYIEVDLNSIQIAKVLTHAGLEVDGIEKISQGFDKIIVAKVMEVQKHPEADRLCLATVTDGQAFYQVVCGAPNCRPGIKTALAVIGASLTDGDGLRFKIKKSKIRGVESFGMLCSFQELGLTSNLEGIIEFAEHIKEGTDVAELYADTQFEISLTPNLGHCASLVGVARELSAVTGAPVKLPMIHADETDESIDKNASVNVLNQESCPRYTARLIKGITIAPSPNWLKNRLEACGIRSINNIVDVTNYVLLELGHPLHAFDYGLIEGGGLRVRNAHHHEHFVTLDGKDRLLESHDLLICDQSKPIALAGIMGGLNSEVTDATRDVLIESAYFSPSAIRKTSKRLGLITDASKRFERGTDPNILIDAVNRAAMLIKEVAGGEICAGVIDVAVKEFPQKQIFCRLIRVNQILGTHLSVSEVENVFQKLGMLSKWNEHDAFLVTVPTYRNDLKEEIDLIEEVARIYGFENINKAAPRFTPSQLPHDPMFLFERKVRSILLGEGLQEFLTCDLIGPSLLAIVKESEMKEDTLIKVLNPTSIEQSILRTSLLPGLLQVVKYNWDHQNQNLAGFEIGRIHFKEGGQFKEQSVASLILTGKQRPGHWDVKSVDCDFFDLKGIMENLLSELRIKNISFRKTSLSVFHPGRSSSIFAGSLKIGSLGEIHPQITRRLDVPQRILFAEINLPDLYQNRTSGSKMQTIPLYPGSERDWTVTLPVEMPIDAIFEALNAASSTLLESVFLLDIYRSVKLGKDLKNATFRFLYRDLSKTISQVTVDAEHTQIVAKVTSLIHPINTG